jgi:alpha-2-macroglobulin
MRSFLITAAAAVFMLAAVSCGRSAPVQRPNPDVAEARGDALAIPPLPLPRELHTGDGPTERGLEVRLREAAGAPPFDTGLAPAAGPVDTLASERAAALLARLAALPQSVEEPFRFPATSPPPPRTGRTVLAGFPVADDTLRPPPPPARMPLQVTRVVPTGEAELAPHVTITFSQPMVPLTSVAGAEAGAPPASLSPQPPGRWSWIDPRTLRYEPDGRLPMATRFVVEVPAGTRSADGTALTDAFRAEFETPAPRAVGGFPALQPGTPEERLRGPRGVWYEDTGQEHALSARHDPIIVISFDQRIDPATVLRTTHLTADGGVRPIRLAAAEEIAADSLVARLVVGLPDGRWLALRPVQRLPGAAEIRVVVERGTASAEGPLTTALTQELRFRTYGPLRVAEHGCTYGDDCPPGVPWGIAFTNPLDATSPAADLVEVEPELRDMSVNVSGAQIHIIGDALPYTRYRVTLTDAVRDRFGQRLGGTRTLTFTTGPPIAALEVPGAPLIVLDPAGPPLVAVRSRGHASLRVRLYRVTPEQWPSWGAALEQMNAERRRTLQPPGQLVTDTRVEPAGRGRDFAETHIDVSAALNDGLGHAILLVEPADAIEDPQQPALAFAWVQSTRLGVSASADGEELFVWTTSLETGDAVGGVEIVGVPTNRSTRTDASGLARLSLVDGGDHAVLARRGSDAALLPAHEYPTQRGGGWSLRPGMSELRWYTFTDRGLYQPGETVHLKGWLRRMPSGRSAAPALADDVTSIAFRMAGPRGEELRTATLRTGALGGFNTTVELPEALNLGHAGIELHAQGPRGEEPGSRSWHGVQVQEFRRPDYDVAVSAESGPHIVGGRIDVALGASYYGGGGLGGAPVEWRVRTQPGTYAPPGWQRWRFGRSPWWGYAPRGGTEDVLHGETDGSGAHGVVIDLVSVDPPFATSVRAEAQVHDVTRQVASSGVDLLVHPAALNVGLRTERGWVRRGEPVQVEVIVVDHDGRVVTGRDVVLAVERSTGGYWPMPMVVPQPEPAEPRTVCRVVTAAEPLSCSFTVDSSGSYVLRADVRDDAARVSRTELRVYVAGDAGAPDPRGEPNRFGMVADRAEYQPGDTAVILMEPPFLPAEALLTVRAAGILSTHRLRVEAAGQAFRLPITEQHIGGVQVRSDVVDADDGLRFAWGDVELTVPPHPRALYVRVLPRAAVVAPGAETIVDLEVRDAAGRPVRDAEVAFWMVDEAVLALGGYGVRDPLQIFYAPRRAWVQDQHNRRWVLHWPRSAGPGTLSGVLLGDGGRALAGATVRVGDVTAVTSFDGRFTLRGLRPGSYELDITGPDGRNARRTVALPAEGVHLGNIVLGTYGIAIMETTAELQVSAVAPLPPGPPPPPGAAMLARAGIADAVADVDVRADFAPLAVFEPALRTDAEGRVQVRVRLPESLTRYRAMAVAVAGAELFGTGEAAVTARKDLVVRVLAPRFLNHGDRFELPVLVQNTSAASQQVEVAARAAGLELMGAAGRGVTLAPGARVELRFAAAAVRPGTAQVQVIAAAGALSDAAAVTIPVLTPATVEAFALHGSIGGSGAEAVVLPLARPRGVIEGFGGLDVTISSTALQSLTDAVLYLRTYPFEGAEHIASRVLAVAALRDVLSAFAAEGLPSPDELVAGTQRDIADLVARQMPDGGWTFWRGGTRTDPFVSVHVAHALVRARERDFDVPPAALQQAARYLNDIDRQLERWPLRVRQSMNAYSIYVRHRIGDAQALADARRLAAAAPTQVGGELPVEAAGWLLHVLAQDAASSAQAAALRDAIMNRLVETAGTATFAERYEDGTHLLLHSRRRTDAVVLEALIAARADDDVVTKLASSLLAHRMAGRWSGTQENAWVLLALDRYFRTYEATTPAFEGGVWLGDRYVGGDAFRGRSTDRTLVAVPMPDLIRANATELVVAREGEGRMYYRAALRYAPADPRVPPAQRGFTVTRSYAAVDDPTDVTRDEDGTWRVRAGARVRVSLSVVAPSVRYHVALVDPLPAGFEPINPDLRGTGFADEPMPRQPIPGARLDAPRALPPPLPWQRAWFEHQNLRDDRAEAFASLLPAGSYEYSYLARATTPGAFVVPPPRAEMMYEPETFGRAAGEVVVVVPDGG